MDHDGKLVPLDRKPPGALDVPVQGPASYTPWDQPRETHLLDYVLILRKHQWLILFFLLTVVSIVSIATFKMRPVYITSAKLEIDRENQNILPFEQSGSYELYWDLENYIETQARILQSETLAFQTIKSLDLPKHPDFGGGKGAPLPASLSTADAPQKRPGILGAFLGGLSVKRIPNSRLLEVQYESYDPVLAARAVNVHLENFIEHNFRSKYEATTQASKWLSSRLDELKIGVEKSEDARLAYEREHQIWTIDEKQNITTQKLSDLNKELTAAQAERIQKESLTQLARSGNLDAVPTVRDSTTIQELFRKQADLQGQYSEAVAQFGPKYPRVERLELQIRDLESLIHREKQNIVARIDIEYRTAKQREFLLTQALEKQKQEANELGQKLVQFNILKREAETNKQLYEGMLQKLKEASISAGLRSTNVRIVDPALVPPSPSRPNRMRNIMLAFLVGLVGGVGLAFLREYMDNTVKTPHDIEFATNLPSLAVVPALGTGNGRGRMPKLLKGPSVATDDARVELVSHEHPQSQISEAFRALRTSLLLSQADHPPQVILLTSALPREGKTTAAVNLAVTLAQLGDRTLLIDADLRKPGISRLLNLTDGKHAGLSTYLAGVSSLDLVTIPHPRITNLAAIPTGPLPPNPADLLSSLRMREAIAALRREYKFIVIDSPPIMAATDAVIISALCDGVLLVARSGETPREALTRTRDLLAAVHSRVLGVILNAVDLSAPQYYYSYSYYPYDYYGGEKDREKGKSA
jgi:capsular exopolysaccharide synthesis family protein